ncbi:hypothetical protein MMC09_001214 [Bachmanniomyces sp. S44760]|nr:hypothetical protein [Bachmanniomyces sp. S44760]
MPTALQMASTQHRPFTHVCSLLSALEASLASGELDATVTNNQFIIKQWFHTHNAQLSPASLSSKLNPDEAIAFLSTLLPHLRPDRVYNLQRSRLRKILCRCLGISESDAMGGRAKELNRWRDPAGGNKGDLGDCVQRVMAQTEFEVPEKGEEVTVLQIDGALNEIAGLCRFSSPRIHAGRSEDGRMQENKAITIIEQVLGRILRRLRSWEAKWFVRCILKDYAPVVLPQDFVLRCFHPALPKVMKVRDSLQDAVAALYQDFHGILLSGSGHIDYQAIAKGSSDAFKPKLGTKVGRPTFLKARSIKHAVQMAQGRRMVLERKYDGEYCQIHLDLTKEHGKEIQIFSKSGKESTVDKIGVHHAIRDCLHVGEKDCSFSKYCILEGEIVVWSDKTHEILEFNKLRKHISRSGVFIGSAEDSQRHAHEHLMMVFYDILLVDRDPILYLPQRQRRRRLENIINEIPGRAALAEYREIDFYSRKAPGILIKCLSHAFANRWEGYVLKPSSEPYLGRIGMAATQSSNPYSRCFIKLKKDYITGFGDTADLTVIGAGYNAAEAARRMISHLPWTHFHIGCLLNKQEVMESCAKPRFKIIEAFNQCISRSDMEMLCRLGRFRAMDVLSEEAKSAFEVEVESGLSCKLDVLFWKPFVFEVLGSGFDKPSNRDYFALRFPRLVKVHWDRDFEQTVDFEELQRLALEARTAPREGLSEEVKRWETRLTLSERGKKNDKGWWEDTQENGEETDESLPQGGFSIHMDSTITSKNIYSRGSLSTETGPPESDTSEMRESVKRTAFMKRNRDLDESSTIEPSPKKLKMALDNGFEPCSNSSRIICLKPSLGPARGYKQPLGDITNSPLLQQISPPRTTRAKTTRDGANAPQAVWKSTSTSKARPRNDCASSSLQAHLRGSNPVSSNRNSTSKHPLPNLSQSRIILDPYISETPTLKDHLIKNSASNIINLSKPLSDEESPNHHPNKPIIVLVDSHATDQTAAFLRSLTPLAKQLKSQFMIWDWRIVEQMEGGGDRDRDLHHNHKASKTQRRKYYLASMLCGGDGVKTCWRTGEVSMV